VVRLTTSGNRVSEVELLVNGQQQFLRQPLISPDCIFVLAAGTIESTRLALDSLQSPVLGTKRMGSNLMAHLRSDVTAQIRRTAIPGQPRRCVLGASMSRNSIEATRWSFLAHSLP